MGSLQQSASGIWIAFYRRWDAATGSWRRAKVSTRTRTRDAAEQILERLEAIAAGAAQAAGAGASLSATDAERMVRSILSAAGVRRAGPGVLEWLQICLDRDARRVRPGTWRSYRQALRSVARWLGRDRPLATFSAGDAAACYHALLEGVAPKTANARWRWIRSAFERAAIEELLDRSPAAGVRMVVPRPTVKREPFSLLEAFGIVQTLAAGSARHREWSQAVLLGLLTGARLGDCVQAGTAQIRAGPPPVFVYQASKTGRQLAIPLVLPAAAPLLAAPPGPLCPSLFAQFRREGTSRLSSEFARLVTAAGIAQSWALAPSGRRIARKTFHSLRHTLRTAIVAGGGSDAQADQILGHAAGQGRIYTHREISALAAVLDRALAHPSG